MHVALERQSIKKASLPPLLLQSCPTQQCLLCPNRLCPQRQCPQAAKLTPIGANIQEPYASAFWPVSSHWHRNKGILILWGSFCNTSQCSLNEHLQGQLLLNHPCEACEMWLDSERLRADQCDQDFERLSVTRLLGSFGAASRCQCACHLQVVDELVDEPHRRQMLTANLSFATDMVVCGIYIAWLPWKPGQQNCLINALFSQVEQLMKN